MLTPTCLIESHLWEAYQTDEQWEQLTVIWLQALSNETQHTYVGDISVVLTNNISIQRLNQIYRHKDTPTNVLAFPTSKDFTPISMLGDVVLAFETVLEESQASTKPFLNHTAHLFLHGVLHLLGYDHETPHDAEVMEALEIKILQQLSIPNPYL